MNRNICLLYKVIALGAVCAGMFRAVADEDYTYQSLTNLGPCASSRVLLMNNDTNPTCPIEGQGYHDSSNTVAVGQTYWWHDDTPLDEVLNSGVPVADYLNLQTGVNHILYQKKGEGIEPVKLWELVNCRAGSALRTGANFNMIPWTSTSKPIDDGYAMPTYPPSSGDWAQGAANSNGVKQVAAITMRASTDATIYSPLYEDGIGEIYFDAVNSMRTYNASHIAVEIATEAKEQASEDGDDSLYTPDFSSVTDMSKLKWERVPCEVFKVTPGSGSIAVDDSQSGLKEILMSSVVGNGAEYYRLRICLNFRGPIRFRIVREDVGSTRYLDYQDIILIDNIIASYPPPGATLSPTGIDSDGVGRAQIGRVGAFTEPMLSVGMDTAKPRMTFTADTNGLPAFIDWKCTVTNADFVWRWRYLNQAYGPWDTNKMSLVGSELVGDSAISVTNVEGDIEYFYVADVAGSRYKFYDFANDTPISPPEAESATAHSQTGGLDAKDNPWSRIREGASLWQEMHLVAITVTNIYDQLTVTNDWTMELIGDHTWRGFVGTPTNYTGCTTYLRFVGRNLWETNGLAPVLDSKTWYFPPGDVTEIPMGSIAVTNLGESAENGIPLDCSASYLVFEFVETSGAFTMNRAEYQNFNRWTPEPGKENLFIGDYIRQGDEIITNISYSGSTKQEYSLVLPNLPMSRSTSSYWWENFDQMAGNKDYPFDVPFGLNRMTPNGWRASNGMFINGMFSAATNKATFGMALQLQGCGLGTLSLIDPADVPQGIGTVAFSARLAQYLDFADFYYYVDGTARKNYAISAKATMTTQKRAYSDVSIGSPTLSLVTYYRPGQGCYEFRISRVFATFGNLWDASGVMEIAIYKWYRETDSATGNATWTTKKLKSLRLGNNSTYVPTIGRQYTNTTATGTSPVPYANYFVPPDTSSPNPDVPDNENWTSIYFGAYNDGDNTYLEGGVGGKYTSTIDASSDLLSDTIMMSISVTDTDSPFKKGSYGVCSRECPAVFGNIQSHNLGGVGPYKGQSGIFGVGHSERENIEAGDWGSTAPNRIITWDERRDKTYNTRYEYGLCTAPLNQQLYLKMAPHGDSSNWTDSGLKLNLSSYLPTNVVFSPHTTTPANIQIAVGGSSGDARTDVVVDDIEMSQWAAEDSTSTDLGSVNKWAYVDAWIAGTTNEVYQGAGGTLDDDDVATISRCGHYVKQISDTDYIYVFTNTTAGALASYATFTPKVDLTIKEVFMIGGGGGGGPGGGGGGGGEALWITNSVDYNAGEVGIQIYVGNGGSGGTARYSNNSVRPSSPGNGGTSYVWLKNPMNPTGTLQQYRGYGGYRGGWFYRDSNSYAAGSGSSGGGGAGGGSALITEGHNPNPASGTMIMNSDLHTYGREIYGAGYGGAAVDGAPGGGGGGGLRGIGANGANGAAGTAANPLSVIHPGSDGTNGIAGAYGGKGGDGFPLSVLGDSEIRVAIGELLGNQDAWLGGGGGGGSGKNMDVNVATWGHGAEMAGSGGRDSGGQGGQYTAGTWDTYQATMGARGMMFAGGGGGGGSFIEPSTTAGSNNKSHFITGGGAGGAGIVVMHIKVKDRFAMLHPMRGSESDPMSISTPFMNGISLFSFSWKWADPNAVLQVQVATNGVDETTIRTRRRSLSDGWVNIGDPIRFSEVDETRREEGFTNILIGIRAPASGLVRLLMDPAVVRAARIGSTNNLDSMYGAISITGMKAFDEPAIDERSWWGWNIMPTYMTDWTYLYDPVTIGPGRTCALNFAGIDDGTAENAPKFADDPSTADYAKHDPFVQTPVFSNSIGAVSFRARLFTNFTESAWVSISGCTNPEKEEDDDTNWTVLTNIEIEAGTTVFKQYSWRVPSSYSDYKAIRLTTFGAAGGRNYEKESYKPFGDNGTKNPVPIQRVLIDEITVSQPMSPKVALKNAYPFRHNTTKYEAIATEKIVSPDEQPILGETFGVQAQVMPAGMEDELDVQSIRVYLGWYAGESPWGYENWKDLPGAVKKVELKRASDWSVGNLVYRSSPDDAEAFIPPQLAGDNGYQIVQYHLWAEYTNKNGIEQEPHDLTKSDWIMPSWYRGIEDPNKINDPVFCAFTVLDTISPKRAWINEINTFDGNLLDDKHQYLEIAVPQGFDMTGWTLNFLRDDDSYTLYPLANIGYDGVPGVKTMNATNAYAFIAIQSPKTKEAGSYSSDAFKNLNDGAWMRTAFEGGIVDVANPYALRLLRPTGIIEHEVVFMSTNTSTSRVRYTYEGTNLLRKLVAAFPDDSWMYSGADGDGGSLGVYTNHGEETYCWTNSMKQTPGWVNMTADNVPQFIDEHYFEPPNGTNLWIYANIDGGSVNTLEMVIGNVTNTSAVLIVPQNSDGTFSTSIVYRVRKWFEIDSIVTNEYGHAGGAVPGVEGTGGEFTLALDGITISDPDNRKFEILASARDSSKIAALGEYGIDKNDPYYPAVIDWLQNYEEADIQLAEYWNANVDEKCCDLTLKEMYWLDIPPVTESGGREWILKAGFKDAAISGGGVIGQEEIVTPDGLVTNVRMKVIMMITNKLWNAANGYADPRAPYPPYTLRGLEPGSVSSNYNEHVDSNWPAVAFKITGALQNGRVNNVFRPLRWFTFCPDSFGAPGTADEFCRTIDIRYPFSRGQPGFSYEWYKHPGCTILYRWNISDEDDRPPITVQQLNDENALNP